MKLCSETLLVVTWWLVIDNVWLKPGKICRFSFSYQSHKWSNEAIRLVLNMLKKRWYKNRKEKSGQSVVVLNRETVRVWECSLNMRGGNIWEKRTRLAQCREKIQQDNSKWCNLNQEEARHQILRRLPSYFSSRLYCCHMYSRETI